MEMKNWKKLLNEGKTLSESKYVQIPDDKSLNKMSVDALITLAKSFRIVKKPFKKQLVNYLSSLR